MTHDKPFLISVVVSVQNNLVECKDGWSFFVPTDLCQTIPTVGEKILLYGKGFGYGVRGIVIGGRTYKYLTEEVYENRVRLDAEKTKRKMEEENKKFRTFPKPPLYKFEVNDLESWNKHVEINSQDPYSYATVRYATHWASLMERELSSGKRGSVEMVRKASHDADTDGITGAMHGFAKSILKHCWARCHEVQWE